MQSRGRRAVVQQLAVAARFHHASIVDHDDAIRIDAAYVAERVGKMSRDHSRPICST